MGRSRRKSIKNLYRSPTNNTEHVSLWGALHIGPDRVAGIVAATQLDNALTVALTARLVPLSRPDLDRLFGSMGPLATFHHRIEIGYAIGLIGRRTQKDLHLIREIRNAFAHSLLEVSFETPEIIEWIGKLTFPDRAGHIQASMWPPKSIRDRYVLTASNLALALSDLTTDNPDAMDWPLD